MTLRLHALIEFICMIAVQVAVERVAFLERVREISGMRLGLEATYREWSVLVGCSVPASKCRVTS